jgi:peptidoglycan/LPS O-acetylase OafA/YrhL
MLLNFERKQLSGLVWLRIALAIYLVLFHTLDQIKHLPEWAYHAVSAGYISTSTFFILSGFVLAHAYLNADGQMRIPKRKFLKTRFLTVYPLHVVGLVLAALIMWGQYETKGAVFAVADIPTALIGLTNEEQFIALGPLEIALNALAHLLLLHACLLYTSPSPRDH